MRMCWPSSPMVWRGRRGGASPTGYRVSRRSSRPVSGWGQHRWRVCFRGWPARWPGRIRRGRGWPGGDWSPSTGPVWMWPTRRPMMSTSAGPQPPGVKRLPFPQARVVALAECATHAVFAVQIGAYRDSETKLTDQLLGTLSTGMLLLADRGFFSYALWRKASATGADLLWRIRTGTGGPEPVPVQDLPDGSWLAHLRATTDRRSTPMLARVIDYTINDARDNPTSYRLLTTLTDPEQAPAVELAAAYTQRWEIENTFDELKTHQRGPRVVLRSKSPDLVLQEIWGHLCCHYAIRTLMWEAADHAGVDPDRVSFVSALRITRQSVAQQGAFPPLTTPKPPTATGAPSCADC